MHHIRIIHSEKDRAEAAWLACKLKWYYLRNRNSNSATISRKGPLYSDEPKTQNYLIVLCSFHSVHDTKISEAIIRFTEKEPITHVISYTISGTPYAKDEEDECVPHILSKLTQRDLLAINSVTLGKRVALHKVISIIHEIPLSELEQRSKKQVRRQFLLLALLCCIFVVYVSWSEYSTDTHTVYYRSFTYRAAVPVGIDKLNPIELYGCDDYYIFRMHEDLPLSVQRIGNPVGVQSAIPAVQDFYDAVDSLYIVFSYHTDDSLDAAVHADPEGNIRFVLNYNSGVKMVDLSEHPDGLSPYFLTLKQEQTNFSRCLFSYDLEGNLTEIQYYTNSRNQ